MPAGCIWASRWLRLLSVLLLLIHSLLLLQLLMWDSVFGPCYEIQYLGSFHFLQAS